MQLFKKAAVAIKNSPWVIPITLVFVALFVISIVLMAEDYSTSLAGYQALPTRKAIEWIDYFVAAIPQLTQVALVYIFVDNTQKKWAMLGGVGAWLLDSALDVYYKSHDLGWTIFGIAIIETTVVYTFGSEIMFTLSAGMLLQLLPSFFHQLGEILSGIAGGGTNGFIKLLRSLGALGVENDKSEAKKFDASLSAGRPGRPKGSGNNRSVAFDSFDSEVS